MCLLVKSYELLTLTSEATKELGETLKREDDFVFKGVYGSKKGKR